MEMVQIVKYLYKLYVDLILIIVHDHIYYVVFNYMKRIFDWMIYIFLLKKKEFYVQLF